MVSYCYSPGGVGMQKFLAAFLTICILLTFSACKKEDVYVKVGVVGENNEQWEQVIIPTLEKEGIHIELVQYNDYVMPNRKLADGEIDMNAFQHYNFLNNWNEENGEYYNVTLAALCDTLIAPLGIYSLHISSFTELKQGDGVAIMNDDANRSRALRMLEDAGIITLVDTENAFVSLFDIAENPYDLKFFEMEASLTSAAMRDPAIAIAFLNGTHAKDAGFTNSRALWAEELDLHNPLTRGLINVIAVRSDDLNNPVYRRIAEVYHSDEVLALFDTVYAGIYLPAWE